MTNKSSDSEELSSVLVRDGELSRLLLSLWQRTRIDWTFASGQLAAAFRREKSLGSSERRLLAETLYGMIRHKRRTEAALERAEVRGSAATDRVQLVAYLVLEGAVEPSYAAQHVKRVDWEKVATFATDVASLKPLWRRLALVHSLPDWLAKRFLDEYGQEEAFALAEALSKRAPMTVRVNRLKGTRDDLVARLAKRGIETRSGQWSSDALHFETRLNLFGLPEFKEGWFEAMDEGSQLIAQAVAPPPRSTVIDLCAGAGGKTLSLAAELQNRGRVLATDVVAAKLAELKRRAKRAGVSNHQSALLDESGWASALSKVSGKAERVLVDAPCSGVGALRRNPESKWRLGEGEAGSFSALQASLIDRAYEIVAPGGRIIYATCTILRAENEAVVESALSRHPDLELFPLKDVWGKERALSVGDGVVLKTLPHVHGTDGFFAAILRRRSS